MRVDHVPAGLGRGLRDIDGERLHVARVVLPRRHVERILAVVLPRRRVAKHLRSGFRIESLGIGVCGVRFED